MITKLLNSIPLHTGNRGIDKDALWSFAKDSQLNFRPTRHSVSAVFRIKDVEHSLWLSYLTIAPLCDEIIVIDNGSSDKTPSIIDMIATHCKASKRKFIHQNYNQKIARFGKDYQQVLSDNPAQSIASYYNYAFSFVTSDYAIKADAGTLFFPKALSAMQRKINNSRPIIRMRGIEYFGKTMAYEPRLFSMSAYDGFYDGRDYEIIQLKQPIQKYDPRNFYFPPAYLHFSRLIALQQHTD